MIDIVQMIIMVDDSPNDFGPNGLIQMRVLKKIRIAISQVQKSFQRTASDTWIIFFRVLEFSKKN